MEEAQNILIKAVLDTSAKPNRNGNIRVLIFVNDANGYENILTETIWVSSKSISLIK
jgi:hypothetical protein